MSYIDTRFCQECDADYDWASPECPGCSTRRIWNERDLKIAALRAAAQDALHELSILPSYLDDPGTNWPNAGLKILAKAHRKTHAALAEALAKLDAKK